MVKLAEIRSWGILYGEFGPGVRSQRVADVPDDP